MAQLVNEEISHAEFVTENPALEAYQGGSSFYLSSVLFSVPLICFAGALISDITYVNDPDIQWSNFSTWLLAFGILFLGLSIIVSILRSLIAIRSRPVNWLAGFLALAAFATGLLDNFIHSHDGWTSVWPVGLMLSALTVLLLVFVVVLKVSSLSNAYLVDVT